VKTIHLCVSVRGLLHHSDRELRNFLKWITGDGGKPFASVTALRAALMEELSQGNEVLPTGPCEGFDYKTGCPGHEQQPGDGQ
jgi:hypothetical protein